MSSPSSPLNSTIRELVPTNCHKEYMCHVSEIHQMQLQKHQILHRIALLQRENDAPDEEIPLLQRKLEVKNRIIQQMQADLLIEVNDMEARLQRLLG
ncbi:hypothetical protein O181_131382 [Austropuccinia psidii MF-1]|uniref:Uncharacterized protein n=1 Tax=Austropuccinia psidii MF-1 TaxID=1389203 RepID=A0A9Q3QD95_9BASI|nr:hypothetical protein [Austropuccinia psidii MF-1]